MSLASSIFNAFSADKAAKTQERAARAAGDQIWKQYETTRSDLQPYRETGGNALSDYAALHGLNGQEAYSKALGNYTQSPFLADLVSKTRDSVESSRAARGGLFSGGTAQEIGDRTGQLYLGDFNNYLSRLGGMAESGQSAAAQTGQFGANAALGKADAINQVGQYKAQQAVIPAMAWRQFTNDVTKAAGAFAGGGFGGGGR